MPDNDLTTAADTLTLDSDLSELERLREFVEGFCERAALPEETCFRVSVALEELVVNAVTHGRCDPAGSAIRIDLTRDGARVRISYSDNGSPFDPLAAPAPELGKDVARRPIGGLGIHLVRCLIPDMRYERRDGRNCLLLTKAIGGADADRHGDCPR